MRHNRKTHAGSWGSWVVLCLLCIGCGQAEAPNASRPDAAGAPGAAEKTDATGATDAAGETEADVSSSEGVDNSATESPRAPGDSFRAVSVLPFTARSANETLADKLASKRDAGADNWKSEVANEDVVSQLKHLEALIRTAATGAPLQSQDLVSPAFVGTSLRPSQLVTTKLAEGITVRSAAVASSESLPEVRGMKGFAELVSDLITPLLPCKVRHIKFKLVRIYTPEGVVNTRVIPQASFQGDDRTM